MPLYRIKDWNVHFENSRSREIENCSHAYVPNKQHGLGFTFILSQPDGAAILGIWYLIVEACSLQKKRNGYLTDTGTADGRQWTGSTLALRWRRTADEVERALTVLTSKDVGWIEIENELPSKCRRTAVEVPPNCRQKGREGKGTELSIDDQAEAIYQQYPKKVGKQAAIANIRKVLGDPDSRHTYETLLEATQAYAQAVSTWSPDDRQYIKDPERWFKKGCYDDDRSTWNRTSLSYDDENFDPLVALKREKGNS